MFCPNCGTNNKVGQSFCRSCGLNLEQISDSLVEQLPSAEKASLLKNERAIDRFGQFALGGLGVVGLIGISAGIWILVTRVLATGTSPLAAALLIAFIVFALLSLVFVILNEGMKEKKAKINSNLAPELNGASETSKLLEDKHFVAIPSVVEDTTDLLPVENRTRKL
jgi:hypothetical protein